VLTHLGQGGLTHIHIRVTTQMDRQDLRLDHERVSFKPD